MINHSYYATVRIAFSCVSNSQLFSVVHYPAHQLPYIKIKLARGIPPPFQILVGSTVQSRCAYQHATKSKFP